GAARGFLMLIEEGRKLRFKVGRSMNQQTIQAEGQTSKTVIKQVIQSGRPFLLSDPTQGNITSSSLSGLRLHSIMCAPVTFTQADGSTQVGGVLYVDCSAALKTFRDDDLSILIAVAEFAATAIQNAVTMEKAQAGDPDAIAKVGKLEANFARLLEVGRAISGTLVLEDLLELVMEKALEVTRADRGFLMLLEEGKADPQFKIGLTWNKKDGDARKIRKLTEVQFFFSRSVCRKALEDKRSVVLQDAQGGGGEDASVSIMQMDLNSVMVTPLIEKGNILGLLYVDSKMEAKAFGDSDVELFEALAGQAAIGLKNALLYGQVASQQRMESELALASQMQQDLCPKEVPPVTGIEMVGMMEPAKEVGGDYYDFCPDSERPNDLCAIVVGDVSGKGLGAGMVALIARCFLRSMLGAYGMEDPSQLLNYLNHTMCAETKPGKFMTMLLCVWDAARNTVTYASAGHENIIVWRAATRQAQAITSGGSPLALSTTRGGPTPNASLTLNMGDMLVLYTDGVTEAMDMEDNEYELERLLPLVNQIGGQSPAVVMNTILQALLKHRGEREQTDDITMVIMRRV
ncbi:SpoIIE family protein phosphatase, partial [Planctomycetota bacterium]|nr:SpoIIE family protein phosphatase [Planctomycetota bacterium]